MKFVQLEQGTNDWLNWRRGLLTASDAASIMGISPYCTPLQCWQRKVGLIPEQTKTLAMQRGIDDEPIAREMFNQLYCNQLGTWMEPAIIQNTEKPFLGASLDGICKSPEFPGSYLGLEIKSQQIPAEIPPMHYAQMQHQMLASNGLMELVYYVSYWQGEIDVKECWADNMGFMSKYMPMAKEFWRKVVFMEPPEPTERDYKDMSDNMTWRMLSDSYKNMCAKIEELEGWKKECKDKIIELSSGMNCKGHGMKICHRTTRGRIDYDSIPELQGVDLEQYRKKSSTSCAILLDAKKDF